MGFILRIWATVVVAIKRLFSQRGLALATTLGLVAAVALVMSVPTYADAVYYRMLRAGLFDAPNEEMVREHAMKGGFPANVVSRVYSVIDPTTAE